MTLLTEGYPTLVCDLLTPEALLANLDARKLRLEVPAGLGRNLVEEHPAIVADEEHRPHHHGRTFCNDLWGHIPRLGGHDNGGRRRYNCPPVGC
jgi:hypothetical protein